MILFRLITKNLIHLRGGRRFLTSTNISIFV